MMYHKTNINRIMSEYTGQTVEQVEADTDRDRYMSPLEAKKYGIIDEARPSASPPAPCLLLHAMWWFL